MVPSQNAEQDQDALRVLRAFVGAVAGYTGDQSYAATDSGMSNPPGQFVTLGPQGTQTEGQPGLMLSSAGASGGLVIPRMAGDP